MCGLSDILFLEASNLERQALLHKSRRNLFTKYAMYCLPNHTANKEGTIICWISRVTLLVGQELGNHLCEEVVLSGK